MNIFVARKIDRCFSVWYMVNYLNDSPEFPVFIYQNDNHKINELSNRGHKVWVYHSVDNQNIHSYYHTNVSEIWEYLIHIKHWKIAKNNKTEKNQEHTIILTKMHISGTC